MSTPESIESRSPSTGELLGSVDVATPDQVRAAVARVRAAQKEWAARPLSQRCHVLGRVADRLIERTDDLALHLAREMGKTRVEAVTTEILPLANLIRYYCREAERILAPEPIEIHVMRNRGSYLHFPPRGVIGMIGPWNFPLSLVSGPAAMALIAGNGVVAKPSEFTPLVQDLARDVFIEGGVPADLFAVVHGTSPTGQALIDGGIDMMIFTGSVATGRKVAAACGERLIPCVTELGGKAPALVLADADLDRTAHALLWGGFANCGQVCASVERLLVHQSVFQPLVDKLEPMVRGLVPGDPTSFGTQVGPLNNQRQLRIVESLVQDAVERGARAVQADVPEKVRGTGNFFPPTLLVGATPEMRIMNEETFGPVVPVMALPEEDAMVAEANRSHLGLLAYVFSRDRARARALAERIEAGTVMVNDVLSSHGFPETPWGGIKASGIGHTHSDQGLRDLCQQRHVNYDLLPNLKRELWWYPYSEKSYRLMKRFTGTVFGGSLASRWRALRG